MPKKPKNPEQRFKIVSRSPRLSGTTFVLSDNRITKPVSVRMRSKANGREYACLRCRSARCEHTTFLAAEINQEMRKAGRAVPEWLAENDVVEKEFVESLRRNPNGE